MRIGFFSGEYLRGGAQRSVTEPLARALRRAGHEVFVLDLSPCRSQITTIRGVIIYVAATRLHLLRYPHDALAVLKEQFESAYHRFTGQTQPETKKPCAFHLFLGKLQRTFAVVCRLDVLYTLFSPNLVGLRSVRMPRSLLIVVNFIGFGIDPKRGGGWDCFPYQHYIFEQPFWDLHIAASEFEYRQYRKVYEGMGLPVEKLMHLPHSFDEDYFYPMPEDTRSSLRQKYGINEEHCVLIYPVQVYPRKNIEMALEIVARMQQERETMLIVTGYVLDEKYYSGLLAVVEQYGLQDKVRFLRGVPIAELAAFLNLADVTVFPSHQETFGIGLIESLACGTPVVGPGYIHPCREILASSSGAWVAQKDVEYFCQQIKLALQSRPSRERVAGEARDKFGSRAIAQRWLTKVQATREQKLARQSYLETLDWRALYEDDLDLLSGPHL